MAELLLGTRVTFANTWLFLLWVLPVVSGVWAMPTRTLCYYGMCTLPTEDIPLFPLRCIIRGYALAE